jgi:Xaa-Pro aminopeptidase
MVDQRLRRLADALENEGVDVCLITHTADIRWLTGFEGVFDDERAHLALIARDPALGDSVLFTDTRYSGALRELDAHGRWRIIDERRPRFACVSEILGELFGTWTASEAVRIAVESDLRLDSYRALRRSLDELGRPVTGWAEPVEIVGLVSRLRAVKDAEEVKALRAAQAITDAAFTHMLEYLRPGLMEREAATELEFFMRRAGADGVAFPSIIASGPNSAVPHAVPGNRVFERGDFVLMDFGARLDDYRSDMTRTVVLGEADERQRAMYEAVLAAQTAVIEALGPGMSGHEAQGIADAALAERGFEGRLIHSLGHGVGIDVHELPVLAPKAEAKLQPGHVVTVEPGVYLEGIGGVRIEDFGVITESGFEAFTQSPHGLIEL